MRQKQITAFYKTTLVCLGTALFGCFAILSHAETRLDFAFRDKEQYNNVTVREVLSTDTFILEDGEKIRLIGLRAPSPPKNRKAIERDAYGFRVQNDDSPYDPIEEQAFVFVQGLLEGKKVSLEFDEEKRDEQHLTYAYVFLADDQIFVNETILKQGFAYLQIRPPNTKYAARLRAAYREAHAEHRGLQGEY